MTSFKGARFFVAAVAAAVCLQASISLAITSTWTGAINNNWNTTDANWNNTNAGLYTVGDDAVFTDNFGSNPTITPAATMNPLSLTFSHIAGVGPTTYAFGTMAVQGNPIFGAAGNTALLLDTGFLGEVLLYARANNTGAGTTTIKSGTLEIHDGGALPTNGVSNNVPGTVTLDGGTLSIKVDTATNTTPSSGQLNAPLTVASNSTLQNNSTAGTNIRIWGNGAVNVPNGVTLTIRPNVTGTAGIISTMNSNLTGSTGTFSLGANSGVWRLDPASAGSTTATFDLGTASGVLRTNANNQVMNLGALTGASTTQIQGSTTASAVTTISVGASNLNTTFSGTIVDGTGTTARVNLTKVGTGTLTLPNANTYSGTTTVSDGVLLVTGTHTNAGAYNVDGTGGTLGGDGTITTRSVMDVFFGVNVLAGGKLAPGTSPGTLKMDLGTAALDISGGVTAPASQSMLFDLDLPGSSDLVQLINASSLLNIGAGLLEFDDFLFTPTVNLTAGTYPLFDTSAAILGSLGAGLSGAIDANYNGTLALANGGQDIVLEVTAVPEPASALLMAVAAAALGWTTYRRRKAA